MPRLASLLSISSVALSLVASIAATGCDEDPVVEPRTCSAPGADVVGEVADVHFDAIRGVDIVRLGDSMTALVADELPEGCVTTDEPLPGEPPEDGYQRLVIGFAKVELAVGSFTVTGDPHALSAVFGLIEGSGEGGEQSGRDLAMATGGTVVIDSVEPCVTGSFHLEFEGGKVLDGALAIPECVE